MNASKLTAIFESKGFKGTILAISVLLLLGIVGLIYFSMQHESPDPVTIMVLLIAAVLVFLFISVFLVSNRSTTFFTFMKRGRVRVSKLRKRVIIAFSIGAALPAIVGAIFSIYFFNISVQAWFDSKVNRVLEQSVIVGESYVSEHVVQLKETAISVSDDLSAMYYDIVHDAEIFAKVLNAQAEMRSLDEAIVFQKGTNTILAQTSLSFSLSFATIPAHMMKKADNGEVVQLPSDNTKIRVLIRLHDYNDTYLMIGRLIDSKIIDHVNKTEGAAAEYARLKSQINTTQIKFSFVFISITVLLVIVAVIWGRNFAERLVKPIRHLVIAAEKVKNGDLTARVPEHDMKKDELRILSSAFNRMIQQIDRQQKELIVAQRAAAWSDVARQVAHEIKNPLTPIQLSANRLLSKFGEEVSDKEAFTKYIDNIVRKSNDIKTIVSDFVSFARHPAPSFVECNLVEMVGSLIDSRRLINDRLTYIFKPEQKGINFVCDLTQFNQVMENLLINAEQALESVKKAPTIKITLGLEDKKVFVYVEDNGGGFSEVLLETALHAYVTTKKDGSGLGLAIVERIVQEHYGEVSIENAESGGAIVKLSFDLVQLKDKIKH